MKLRFLAILFSAVCLVPFARGQSTAISLPQGGQAGTQFFAPVIWSPAQQKFVLRDSADGQTAASANGSGTGAASTSLTLTITTATTSGTVAAGSRSLIFIFSATFAGTVQGATFAGGTDSSYSPPIPAGTSLNAVTYTVTAGNVRISDAR